MKAIDLLGSSGLEYQGRWYTFTSFYSRFIDKVYATSFLRDLVNLDDVAATGTALLQSYSSRILSTLEDFGVTEAITRGERCLLSFCIYWWTSFGKGYIREVIIFRDLEQSRIHFVAHDLTAEYARFAPHNLIISGMRGDVKTSTYFLHTARVLAQQNDFYITRLYDAKRRQWLDVVFMTPQTWRIINGETIESTLEHLPEILPSATHIRVGRNQFVVIGYEYWKRKIKAMQVEPR
ncbi:MAG: hypothetical protein ACE5PV_25275 [Candidatus Poribacteria bacterium]